MEPVKKISESNLCYDQGHPINLIEYENIIDPNNRIILTSDLQPYIGTTTRPDKSRVSELGERAGRALLKEPKSRGELDGLSRKLPLVAIYRDLPLGAVDAMVVATAERLSATTVATIDRRHFSIVRPSHVPHFELLPDVHWDRVKRGPDIERSAGQGSR